ncbi:hypothetical protein ACLB2K_056362 [Fragaria x ananassa]
MYTTLAHAKQFLIPHPNDAVSSPLGLDLNFSGLNIHRENMFLDDPEADFNITTVSDTRYSSVRSFDDLNLSPEVLRALIWLLKHTMVLAKLLVSGSYKKLGVSKLKVLVFDEADHMLAEDGFRDDSLRIKKEIDKFSPHCQVLLFSATFNEMITKFIPRVMKDYNQLTLKKEELSLEAVKQYKVYCPDELDKIEVIRSKIFDLGDYIGQTIIFVRSRNSAKMLHEELVRDGHSVTTVHGALSIEDRDKIVKEFKDGLTKVLISTDLLARGFDQQQVNCVVNYDLPIKRVASSSTRDTPEPDYELYLHRCGRAGRFGSKAVFNLLCLDRDKLVMAKIERYYNIQVPEVMNSERAFQGALRAAGLL